MKKSILASLCVLISFALVLVAPHFLNVKFYEDVKASEPKVVNQVRQQLVCPGPVQLADKTEYDSEFNSMPEKIDTRVRLVATGSVDTAQVSDLNGKGARKLLSRQNSYFYDSEATEPKLLTANYLSADGLAGSLGYSVSHTSKGDLEGLAATKCVIPDDESYFIGGGTKIGDSLQLVLSNPNLTDSQVELTAWASDNSVQKTPDSNLHDALIKKSKYVAVKAGSSKTVDLRSVIPDQDLVAVKVKTKSSQVASYIQYNKLDGLNPRGVDYIDKTSAPSKHALINGIYVDPKSSSSEDASLELLSFDDSTVKYTLKESTPLFGNKKESNSKEETVHLKAGVVTSVKLKDLEKGCYTASIESTSPTLSSAKINKLGANGYVDFAYLQPSEPYSSSMLPVYDKSTFVNISGVSSVSADEGNLNGSGEDSADEGTPEANSAQVSSKDTKIVINALNANGDQLAMKEVSIKAGENLSFEISELQLKGDGQVAYLRIVPQQIGDELSYNSFVTYNGYISAIAPTSVDASFRAMKIIQK